MNPTTTSFFLLLIALLLAAATAHASPSFGSGYPLTILPRNASDAAQAWYFNENGLVTLLAHPINCLETWTGYDGVPSDIVPTLWYCGPRTPITPKAHSNFFYYYDEKKQQLHQNWTNLCFGVAKFAPNEMIKMWSCNGTHAQKNLTKFRRLYSKSLPAHAFQLCTDDDLCVGVPLQYTDSHTIETEHLRIVVGTDGIPPKNFTYVSSFQVWQPTFKKWSINLLDSYASIRDSHYSTSSVVLAGAPNFHHATGGKFTMKGSSKMVLEKIRIGDFAEETWEIDIVKKKTKSKNNNNSQQSETLSWTIHRRYLKDVHESVSRFATFVWMRTSNTLVWQAADAQAPFASMLDTTITRNYSSFTAFKVDFGAGAPWVYAFSRKERSAFSLSPLDVCLRWEKNVSTSNKVPPQYSIDFSYQWVVSSFPIGYGTLGLITTTNNAPWGEYNLSAADKKKYASTVTAMKAGDTVSATLSFSYDSQSQYGGDASSPSTTTTTTHDRTACAPQHALSFTSGDARRDDNTRALGRAFHMPAGNFLKSSPTSTSCVFEAAMYAQATSSFNPDPVAANPLEMPHLFLALRQQVEFWLVWGVNESGYCLNQWDEQTGNLPYPAMAQQQTAVLNAIYTYAVLTGDKEFVSRFWSTKIRALLNYLLVDMGLEKNKLAVFPNPLVNGVPGATAADNWFDIITFGHEDMIINAEAMQVLVGYADLAAWLGDDALSARLTKLHGECVRKINDELFRDGLYADWRDANGHANYFAYIWQQSIASDLTSNITAGAANESRASRNKRICDRFDALYDDMFKKFNVTTDVLFGTPTNFIPVPADLQLDWYQAPGVYENGGIFSQNVAREVTLRFNCNQSKKALQLYDRMMDQFEKYRLWGQHSPWVAAGGYRPGVDNWQGADVLTDTVMLVHALVYGATRVRPTLTRGIVVDGDPGRDLAGFEHSFWHLGERWTAKIDESGKTQLWRYEHPPTPSPGGSNSGDDDSERKKVMLIAGVVGGGVVFAVVVGFFVVWRRRTAGGGGGDEGDYREVQ